MAFAFLLLLASPALAQQPTKPQPLPANDDSTVLFRGLFHFHKIEPETGNGLTLPKYDYSKLIVVVLGDPRNIEVNKHCRAALSNGGAVLIASDTSLPLSSFFPNGGDVQVVGGKVRSDHPHLTDGAQPTRPLVEPVSGAGTNPFGGVERLATNDPSYLLATRPPPGLSLQDVARFPVGMTIVQNNREVQNLGLQLQFALASDDRARQRCMVLADPDVFSNRMIYTSGREQNPTDNLRFANNTVQWLKGNGRNRCLFIERGQHVQKFDEFEFSAIPVGPQIPPPPVPNIDPFDPELQRKVADALNEAADQAQKNDAANRGILSLFQGSKASVVAVMAVVLLFLAYAVFRWRAVGNWYRKVFRPIPRDAAMLGPDVPVGSIEHRRLELLRSADYGPVVRPVVRQLFQDRGLPGEYAGDKLPPLDIDVRRPQFLKEAIHTLWAAVRSPAAIGFGKWKQLEPLLAAVRAAADDDRWRFVAPTPRDDAP